MLTTEPKIEQFSDFMEYYSIYVKKLCGYMHQKNKTIQKQYKFNDLL